MTESAENPRINISEIDEEDALRYRIGEYFETFANMEQFLANALGNVLQMDNALIHFMWKDSFTDHKIKTLRRAALSKLGPEHPRWLALKPTLNEISKQAVEYRNDLAHGLIIREQGKTKRGKPGAHPELLYQDFEEITPDSVHAETQRLSRLAMSLLDFFSGPKVLAE